MRKDVKKSISWIEKFERKATQELDRMNSVEDKIVTEVQDLEEQVRDLNENKATLQNAEKKVKNLLKAINGE